MKSHFQTSISFDSDDYAKIVQAKANGWLTIEIFRAGLIYCSTNLKHKKEVSNENPQT